MNKKIVNIILGLILVVGIFHPNSKAQAAESKVICIDPGHQRKGNNTKEPNAPGSKTMKAKVSSGTQGVSTKKPEYVLVLEISKKLEEKLKERGYQVYMTRTHHDVNLSNVDRAQFCNAKSADLTIRVHADGSTNRNITGIHVLYPSGSYTKSINEKSKLAATHMINEVIKSTSANKANGDGLSPRTDITGFNWAKQPVVLPEVGFMSNPEEDQKLSTNAYQEKLAEGMANGVDRFFGLNGSASAEGEKLLQQLAAYNKAIEAGDINKVNTLYDSLTKRLKNVEMKIGKVSGSSNRANLNERYVRPAKVAVERTIFEVSQYRLLDAIQSTINEGNENQAISETKKLERLKKRAIGIKQSGGYQSLPSKINADLRKSEAETQGALLTRLLNRYNQAINNGDLYVVDGQYDQLTAQLRLTEVKIGQVGGASNRQALNTTYVRPAKIAVERTIYEVSQLRLIEVMRKLTAENQLVKAEANLSVLERLKGRADAIKQVGGYELLPVMIEETLEEVEKEVRVIVTR
ncbi:N-acetylmuramoyl-L-alanine amidase [Metabacillus endolithicus]|uniref:N-acetylmuramoyl-L-alanine amidase n=1 Tax=Metabacillus endolithicus TaxID=1535204 RepID=A0ABW5C106_9BACI|nr:N-acetylmuramoyl-L-alanine amidase [Metabacillus endolithicus]UPG65421.1 N-acetylmuramoyl-L-alanine amidase [Metabacillus endolithicus]